MAKRANEGGGSNRNGRRRQNENGNGNEAAFGYTQKPLRSIRNLYWGARWFCCCCCWRWPWLASACPWCLLVSVSDRGLACIEPVLLLFLFYFAPPCAIALVLCTSHRHAAMVKLDNTDSEMPKSFCCLSFLLTVDSEPTLGAKGLPTTPLFGASLEEAVRMSHIPGTPMVPAILVRCTEFLEVKGVDEVGLYRYVCVFIFYLSLNYPSPHPILHCQPAHFFFCLNRLSSTSLFLLYSLSLFDSQSRTLFPFVCWLVQYILFVVLLSCFSVVLNWPCWLTER